MKNFKLLTTAALMAASLSMLTACFGGGSYDEAAADYNYDQEEDVAMASGFGDEEYDDEEYADEEYDESQWGDEDYADAEASYVNTWLLSDNSGYYIIICDDGTWNLNDDEGTLVTEGSYLVNENSITLYTEEDSFYLEASLNENGELVNVDDEEDVFTAIGTDASEDGNEVATNEDNDSSYDDDEDEEEIQFDSDGNKIIDYEANKKFAGKWKIPNTNNFISIYDDEKYAIYDADQNPIVVCSYTSKGNKITLIEYDEEQNKTTTAFELIEKDKLKRLDNGEIYTLVDEY